MDMFIGVIALITSMAAAYLLAIETLFKKTPIEMFIGKYDNELNDLYKTLNKVHSPFSGNEEILIKTHMSLINLLDVKIKEEKRSLRYYIKRTRVGLLFLASSAALQAISLIVSM